MAILFKKTDGFLSLTSIIIVHEECHPSRTNKKQSSFQRSIALDCLAKLAKTEQGRQLGGCRLGEGIAVSRDLDLIRALIPDYALLHPGYNFISSCRHYVNDYFQSIRCRATHKKKTVFHIG
ncbi:protein of unknown function [Legionella fallonii LLAP-10]|uniref:Uncharacterized protein n=1 Tax=Legionella fallonii LLAP-10 TaxID=1212491 RepID=A0A098G7G4_9GAMM|nr:protein of unknown function [Legionella fallonii LLAP-10]